MKSWFLRITAILMAVILCIAVSACGKDDEDERDSSLEPGQTASEGSNSPVAGNSKPAEPVLPPDEESVQPVDGGVDMPGTLPSLFVTQGQSGGTVSKTTQPKKTAAAEESESRTVRVTIPEGYNIVQIAKKLEANGVCGATDFINTAQTYDFTYYPLVGSIPKKQYRAFKLEGYLFPDTYEFYKNMKPQDAVGKFLRNNVLQSFSSQVAGSGLKNLDEVLTLASIVEREAKTNTEKNIIAGIFLNRLKSGIQLDSDATRDYCIDYLKPNAGKYKKLDQPYMEYAYVYNTYNSSCPGLPTGPICNPGRSSIRAVLNPTKTDALFFCYGKDKKLYTAVTDAEHEHNKKLAGLV